MIGLSSTRVSTEMADIAEGRMHQLFIAPKWATSAMLAFRHLGSRRIVAQAGLEPATSWL
jgi:hypothetical protein